MAVTRTRTKARRQWTEGGTTAHTHNGDENDDGDTRGTTRAAGDHDSDNSGTGLGGGSPPERREVHFFFTLIYLLGTLRTYTRGIVYHLILQCTFLSKILRVLCFASGALASVPHCRVAPGRDT